MRIAVLIILLLGSFCMAEESGEQPEPSASLKKSHGDLAVQGSLIIHEQQMEAVQARSWRQEYVEVSRESYPGLNLALSTTVELLSGYRPEKKPSPQEELRSLHRRLNCDSQGVASDCTPGNFVEVSVPVD
jgi:hypothetical protein